MTWRRSSDGSCRDAQGRTGGGPNSWISQGLSEYLIGPASPSRRILGTGSKCIRGCGSQEVKVQRPPAGGDRRSAVTHLRDRSFTPNERRPLCPIHAQSCRAVRARQATAGRSPCGAASPPRAAALWRPPALSRAARDRRARYTGLKGSVDLDLGLHAFDFLLHCLLSVGASSAIYRCLLER